MMRSKLAKLALEAKKLKTAPLKPQEESGIKTMNMGSRVSSTHYRILESPGCRRVVLTGPTGRLDQRAAESLIWKLQAWETNYLIQAVMLQGRPGKAFSAGWMCGESITRHSSEPSTAFRRYCQLSYLLATLRKPTISWFSGDVVGGGIGLGLARYRISTEKSTFRVSGPAKGWILDGGLSYLLSRPQAGSRSRNQAFARYLALTGAVLAGEGMLAAGISTHHMKDSIAGSLHKRLADLTFEPDFVVEDVLSEHASMFYRQDPSLNPPPYRELWAEWAKNDENRERARKRAEGSGSGFDTDGRWENNDEDVWEDAERDGDATDFNSEEEAAMEAFAEEGEEDPDIRSTLGDMEPLFNVFLAQYPELGPEEGDLAGRSGQRKNAQSSLPSDAEGSLWWHRNFARGDEALFQALWESTEARIKKRIEEEGMESLASISEKFIDRFPEYISYPERTRLVDSDQALLSPWNCSVDRAKQFSEFEELVQRVASCFKGDTLEEVIENLRMDNSEWAKNCLQRMDRMSPLSLRIVFKQLEEAKDCDIEDAFRMDYRVGQRVLALNASHDSSVTSTGLAGLKDLSSDHVASFFQAFTCVTEELRLPEKERVGENQPDRRDIDMELERRFGRTSTTRGSI